MKVIVGLGNPGREYEKTRHNVGWWVVDHLADVWRFDGWKKDGAARVAAGIVRGTRVRLVKPQAFMNISGEVLRPYTRRPFFSIANDMLVVVDEVAFPVGRYRFREKGSAGGHNGLKSVQQHLATSEYGRLRIGVGPPEDRERGVNLSDYVLSAMGKADTAAVHDLLPELTDGVETWIKSGMKETMNKYTGKPPQSDDDNNSE
ncbi:MAG: aminoacyl-tRNA hydrolase [Gemmatimonadetes bacterium]|nr:aminoacyl-tRNA hydrolase [Gemmatimonadota bacterium]